MKVLLDTNVVLDLTLDREPFFADAKQIFIRAALKELEIFVTSVTAINTFYTTRKERDIDVAWTCRHKIVDRCECLPNDKNGPFVGVEYGILGFRRCCPMCFCGSDGA